MVVVAQLVRARVCGTWGREFKSPQPPHSIMIKAILFDFDDTLVKTKEIRYKALKKAAKVFYNLNITDADIDNEWGKPFDIFISGVFKHIDIPEILTQNYKSILHEFPNEAFLNTNSTIKILADKYILGIISSSNPDLILSGMKDVNLDTKYFFHIQSSKDTDIHKPNGAVFLPALTRLSEKNIIKNQVLYVGDAIDDYMAAKDADINFVAISDRTVSKKEFILRGIPFVTDINNLIDNIEKK